MMNHCSAIAKQVQTDWNFFNSVDRPSFLEKNNLKDFDLDKFKQKCHEELRQLSYAGGRLLCVELMIFSSLGVLMSLKNQSLNAIAISISMLVIEHDIFQILKNREEIEFNQSTLKVVTALAKSCFCAGKTFFNSILNGENKDEIKRSTFRAIFNEIATIQSKNTFLKPLWNELQFQLAIRDYNPFPIYYNPFPI